MAGDASAYSVGTMISYVLPDGSEEFHRDEVCSQELHVMAWPGQGAKESRQSLPVLPSCEKAPPVAPLHPWVWPFRPWQRVHLDFASLFQGCMFLIGVDAYSKWPEVKVMSTTTVSKTLDVLSEWFASYGSILEHIITDNGLQFTAEEFKTFTNRNGIKHVKSAPYHPASNGLVERFIQSLKQIPKASQDNGRSLSQRSSAANHSICS